jgi:hypothetical protein
MPTSHTDDHRLHRGKLALIRGAMQPCCATPAGYEPAAR